MSFRFQVTTVQQDLLDAYEAELRSSTGMRPWIRVFMVVWGVMALVGSAAMVWAGWKVRYRWQPLVGLLFGTVLVWVYGIRPFLTRRRICARNVAAQSVTLEFVESGLQIESPNGERVNRRWDEVALIESADFGFTLSYWDGTMNVLPRRVFQSDAERQAFHEFVSSRILASNQSPEEQDEKT